MTASGSSSARRSAPASCRSSTCGRVASGSWRASRPTAGPAGDAPAWSGPDAVYGGDAAFGWDECLPTVAPCPDPADPAGAAAPGPRRPLGTAGRRPDARAPSWPRRGTSRRRVGRVGPYRFTRRLRLDGPRVIAEYELENRGAGELPVALVDAPAPRPRAGCPPRGRGAGVRPGDQRRSGCRSRPFPGAPTGRRRPGRTAARSPSTSCATRRPGRRSRPSAAGSSTGAGTRDAARACPGSPAVGPARRRAPGADLVRADRPQPRDLGRRRRMARRARRPARPARPGADDLAGRRPRLGDPGRPGARARAGRAGRLVGDLPRSRPGRGAGRVGEPAGTPPAAGAAGRRGCRPAGCPQRDAARRGRSDARGSSRTRLPRRGRAGGRGPRPAPAASRELPSGPSG